MKIQAFWKKYRVETIVISSFFSIILFITLITADEPPSQKLVENYSSDQSASTTGLESSEDYVGPPDGSIHPFFLEAREILFSPQACNSILEEETQQKLSMFFDLECKKVVRAAQDYSLYDIYDINLSSLWSIKSDTENADVIIECGGGMRQPVFEAIRIHPGYFSDSLIYKS